MWVMHLNDMRASNIENMTAVARAETVEELKALLTREDCGVYTDGKWRKQFRQGGPLEWYNPPISGDNTFMNVGSEQEFVENARAQYRSVMDTIPEVRVL